MITAQGREGRFLTVGEAEGAMHTAYFGAQLHQTEGKGMPGRGTNMHRLKGGTVGGGLRTFKVGQVVECSTKVSAGDNDSKGGEAGGVAALEVCAKSLALNPST